MYTFPSLMHDVFVLVFAAAGMGLVATIAEDVRRIRRLLEDRTKKE